MKRLFVALLSLSSFAAFAQEVEVETTEVQVPGMTVKMRVSPPPAQPLNEPAPPPDQGPRRRAPKPPPVQVIDTFDLGFEMKPQETIRMLSPEGAHADVWADDASYVGSCDLPCELPARAGMFYRVVISDSSGFVFDRKVELRQYYRTNVSWRGGGRPRRNSGGRGMVDFGALVEAVKAESFGDAKLDVVRTAEGGLTVDQVGQLVDLFSFSEEQVKVVEITNSRLVDRQNAFKLYSHFTFDSDKKKVKAILGK